MKAKQSIPLILMLQLVLAQGADRPVLVDPSFRPELEPASEILTAFGQPDGKVLVSLLSWGSINSLIRLNGDGTLDRSFALGPLLDELIVVIAPQPDGKLLLGTRSTGVYEDGRIFRINPDGTRDPSFSNLPVQSGVANAIILQADGKVLVGGAGYFTSAARTEYRRVTRLLPDGTVDLSFEAPIGKSYDVGALALDSTGRVLVGGQSVNSPRPVLVRLNPDGSLDNGFQPSLEGDSSLGAATVSAVFVLGDGKLLISGNSGFIGGQSALVRLNPDGSLDGGFKLDSPATWARIQRVQPDGKIIALVVESQTYQINRFAPDGARDRGFAPDLVDFPDSPQLS